jgi:hypothetical protein
VKTLKTILALGLVAVCFVGCSKNTNNTNTTTTTTNDNNTKASSSPATMPSMPSMPANTSSNTSTSAANTSEHPTSSGEGETFTNHEAGVQFTLPAGWTSKTEGQKIMATSPMDAISVVLWVPEGDDFNKAVDDLTAQLDKIIKNPKITSPGKETTHNGMPAYTAGGTGEVNGEEIAWEVDVIRAKKPFFVLTFAEPKMFEMHKGDYQELLGSLKKIE